MTGKSYFHRGGYTPLLGDTIPEHFAAIVARFPEQEAVVGLPQQRRLSYRGLARATDELARGLFCAADRCAGHGLRLGQAAGHLGQGRQCWRATAAGLLQGAGSDGSGCEY